MCGFALTDLGLLPLRLRLPRFPLFAPPPFGGSGRLNCPAIRLEEYGRSVKSCGRNGEVGQLIGQIYTNP
jgi:hypothetical protein